MQTHGIPVCASEVHFKISNLTSRYRYNLFFWLIALYFVKHNYIFYRTEKKNVGVSGESLSLWRFYEQIHKIIGSFKCNNLDLMEETINLETTTATDEPTTTFNDIFVSFGKVIVCFNK